MCQEEASNNTEALYQAACQLRIHWSDVIVRNIHYTILLVTAIWGLLGRTYLDNKGAALCGQAGRDWWYLFAAASASSIAIILWRWYSHHLDKAITTLIS